MADIKHRTHNDARGSSHEPRSGSADRQTVREVAERMDARIQAFTKEFARDVAEVAKRRAG